VILSGNGLNLKDPTLVLGNEISKAARVWTLQSRRYYFCNVNKLEIIKTGPEA
jgi:hypothetical protein